MSRQFICTVFTFLDFQSCLGLIITYTIDITNNAVFMYDKDSGDQIPSKRMKLEGKVSVNQYYKKLECDTDFQTYTSYLDKTQNTIWLVSFPHRMSVLNSKHFKFNINTKTLHSLIIDVPYSIEKIMFVDMNNKTELLVYGFIKHIKLEYSLPQNMPNALKEICVQFIDWSYVHVFGKQSENHHSARIDMLYI